MPPMDFFMVTNEIFCKSSAPQKPSEDVVPYVEPLLGDEKSYGNFLR